MDQKSPAATSASPKDRFDSEGDWLARQFFSAADLQMSPEEYAARQAHRWDLFSFHLYRYQDPILGAWVRRVGEILFGAEEEIESLRHHYLTTEELAEVRRVEAEG